MRLSNIEKTLDELHRKVFASRFAYVTLVFEDNQTQPYYKSLLSVIDPALAELLQLFPHSDSVFLPHSGISHFLRDTWQKKGWENIDASKEEQVEIKLEAYPNNSELVKESIHLEEPIQVQENLIENLKFVKPSMIKHTPSLPKKVLDRKQARINALTCNQCGHIAKEFFRLERHIVTMHTVQSFPCDQCGHIARTKGKLRLHIKIMHDNRKPFVCKEQNGFCDFIGKGQGKLDMHIRKKHTGEKFLCDQCDFEAWTNANIMHHKQIVHEGLRFECKHCPASYATKRGLYIHSDRHKGKSFPCQTCEYQATTTGNLKVHKNAKHDKIRFRCNLCSWTGSQSGMVKTHKKQKHAVV